MFGLFDDIMNSRALKKQPVYDSGSARDLLTKLHSAPPEERFVLEMAVQRIVSATLMHERFGFS